MAASRARDIQLDPVIRRAIRMGACDEARRWLLSLPSGTTAAQAWGLCPSGPWLMWALSSMVDRLAIDRMHSVLAACSAARVEPAGNDDSSLLDAVRGCAIDCLVDPSADVGRARDAWAARSRSMPEGRVKYAALSLLTNHDSVASCFSDLARCEPKDRAKYAERLKAAVSWGTWFACAAVSDWRTRAMDEASAEAIRGAVPWSVIEAGWPKLGWEE